MNNSEFIDLSDSAIKIGEFIGHEDEIRSIIFSPDKKYVFSGGWDHKILQWKIKDTKKKDLVDSISKRFIFSGHSDSITCLKNTSDSKYLISSSKDGTVKLWIRKTKECIFTLNHNKQKIFALEIDKYFDYIFSGGEERKIYIWKVEKQGNNNNKINNIKLFKKLHNPSASIHVIKLNRQESFIASTGDENSIYLWDFPYFKFRQQLTGHQKHIYTFDFHPSKPLMASAGKEKKIYIWDFNKGTIIKKIKTPASISYIYYNETGDYLLSVDFSNRVRIYDSHDGSLLQNIHFQKGEKLTIGLSDDWSLFALVPFALKPSKIHIWTFNK